MKNKNKKSQLSFTKKTLINLNENEMKHINAGGKKIDDYFTEIFTLGKTDCH